MPTKRKSAFSRALEEAQQVRSENTVSLQDSIPVIPQDRNNVEQQGRETVTPQESVTAEPQHRATIIPQESNTVSPQYGSTATRLEKVTFYVTLAQLEKLDDLAHEYRKATKRRINRNDIIRRLIDTCNLDALAGL